MKHTTEPSGHHGGDPRLAVQPPARSDGSAATLRRRRGGTARWTAWIAMLAGLCGGPLRAQEPADTMFLPLPVDTVIVDEILVDDTPRPLPPVVSSGPVVLDTPYNVGPWQPEASCPPPGLAGDCFDDLWAPRPWFWQILPANVIWQSYLAGPKEPRFATVWYDDPSSDPIVPTQREGWLWDSTLGGRAAILRYGSDTSIHPQGFEVQIEGAAFVRLDPQEDRDLRSSDYRFGIPLIYGVGRWQTKLAYYHNSAHLGDEAMIRHPDFPRVNYVRDVIVWGNSYYLYDWMRIYGEVGWSFFNSGGSEPWEFQFGTELVQARPTGIHGSPFFAINGMSRQELDWGGNVCVQTGWAWRGDRNGKLFRLGFEYLYGSDPQYEFVFNNQNRAGIGMWYDF